MQRIASVRGHDREVAIVAEVLAGNVPDFLRALVPVCLGRERDAVIWVAPDYLAVGTDDDFLLLPVMARTAQRIADRFGCILPTPRIVDAIFGEAELKLPPIALAAGPNMVRTEAIALHNARIADARRARGGRLSALSAGHKKDIVITRRLGHRPQRLALYGLFRADGEPVQPLSLVHALDYVDYSHGLRLVVDLVRVRGVDRRLSDVLSDPDLADLVSAEGAFTPPRYR